MARLGDNTRGKPNLIGAHAATIPSPHDRPRRQTDKRARRPKDETATRAARPPCCATSPPAARRTREPGSTPAAPLRHSWKVCRGPRPRGQHTRHAQRPRRTPTATGGGSRQLVSWPPHATKTQGLITKITQSSRRSSRPSSFDGICQATHEYALRQRPLFGYL